MEKEEVTMLNKVMLIGNVGQDPEIREFSNGNKVANFSLATSERWKDKNSGEKKEKTEWHRISVFNEGLIKVIDQYVRKGSRLYIEGKIVTRQYEKDGEKRYTTEIHLTGFDGKITLLGEGGGGGGSTVRKAGEGSGSDSGSNRSTADEIDDDIPF